MEYIFDKAEFGDKFLTKNNKVALYIGRTNIVNKEYAQFYVNGIGIVNYELSGKLYDYCDNLLDIVSKYQEPIDEEEMMAAAKFEACQYPHDTVIEAFIAGYQKAKES